MSGAARAGAAVARALARALPDPLPPAIGVAVSGGGDSVALMALLAEWAPARGLRLHAASVDHRLRAEAAAEADLAGRMAARLGIDHETLIWTDPPASGAPGNLQAGARAARYGLLSGWAARRGLAHVCLAHTREDQAETVLMRLARGSGVDGLAAMAEVTRADGDGPVWLRPCLQLPRAALRTVLAERGLDWAEDPGNEDARFDRVKARALLAAPPLPGLDPPTLAETAARMAAARTVLDAAARDAARALARAEMGGIALHAAGFAALPDDTRWRLLAAALRRVGGQAYRPRLRTLRAAEQAALGGRAATLHGCLVSADGAAIRIDREPAAAPHAAAPGDWDGRWRIAGPAGTGATVGPLGGDALAALGGAGGLPRAACRAAPAIRRDGVLLAVPGLRGAAETLPEAARWSAAPIWGTLRFVADFGPD